MLARDLIVRIALGAVLAVLAWTVAAAEDGHDAAIDDLPPIAFEPFPSTALEETFADGRTLYQVGEYAAAVEAFTHVLEAAPEHSFTHYYRALALWEAEAGCSDATLAAFDTAVDQNPEAWWALGDRGVCHRRRGETEAAIADQTAVLGVDDRFGHAYVRRAYVFSTNGLPDKALADLDRAVELAPYMEAYWLAMAHADRGRIHESRGNIEQARRDYERAVALDPNNNDARVGLLRLD